jgi:DHA2 family multidrug resistance protein
MHIPRAEALPHGGSDGTYETALALINQRVIREALLMAYSDTFMIAGLAMLACVAGAFALRGTKA